ncbi:MAG: electron transfer flavoprotein subunit alpha/FixB family protein [Gracilimonas sp.]|uniref:electron transfer flavoprotein subunit alpha/FixB family protein n=1 Tax=Gracilimonas TaxID=649462 RepID=UPI001B05B372|nr:electron transfer flavoprotein subunit alpha/FixB family protein [Gracilimonas sp.]MBO6587177.1 electron transfer flavoprotein subunit alpha/FixB family protein [Gracilimonas sp.]MBO6614335.1 electron transfer flavoprotein subunit alpha/FixB family protein [Gracilimonas sp.]
MSTILTHIAISDGKIKRSSLEVLSHCKKLAESGGHSVEAVIIDEKASSFVDGVKKYGASKIYTVEDPIFKNHMNTPLLKALAKVMETANPYLFAFASTEGTKDILGALAANQDAAVLPDVSSFELGDSGITAKRPVMAAKIIANTEAKGDKILVSVRSGSYDLVENETDAEVVHIDFSMDDNDLKATLKEIISASGDTIDLNEAEAIVAAGRGVKDEEGQNLISELASVLNAGIGASRALTEAGVYDPSLQIGQTGKVVSPQLYIAVGISGAIQHVAGMANSKVIVAINKDPDAPIFEVADYGIVGDLYKVLPPFIEEIKKIKN